MSPLGTLEAPERRPDTELDNSVDNLNTMLPDLGAIDFDKEKAAFDSQTEQVDEDHSYNQLGNLEASVAPEVPTDIHEEITRVRDTLAQAPARPSAPAAPMPRPHQPPASPPPAGQQGPQPPQEHQPPAQPAPAHDVPRFTLGIVDQTKDARVMAGRAADEQLGVETNEGPESGGKLKTFVRSVWKMGSLKPWFRQRRKNQALNEIIEQQDVYLHDGATDEERKQARLAAVDRFVRGKDYYSQHAGEERAELAADSPLATGLKDIIREATDPQGRRPSNDELKRRYQELIAQYPSELKGEGRVTAHNLIEVIDNMRGADLHRDALHHAITNMAIVTGESRAESNKNDHRALNDRIIDKLERFNTKLAGKGGAIGFVGNLAPEGAISLGITGVMIVAGAARDSLIRKAGWAVAPGVGGAAVGALRGWSDANQRIRQHESEREAGKVFQNDKRRQALDALMYEDKPARELIDTLRSTATREKISEGDEALKAALKALAEVTIRQGFFDDGKKVIRFSPGAQKQGELRDLADARRDAAALLGSHISMFDQQTRERLGFPEGANINDIQELPEFGVAIAREIQADIDQKDKDRRAYKLKTGAGAGAIRGAVFSAGVSFGINVAAGGIAELYDGGTKAEAVSQSALVNQNNGISINGDYTIESDFSGLNTDNFDVKEPDGNVIIDNIHKDPVTGKIDDADLKRLVDAGFEVKPIDVPAVTETTTVSVGDYINAHPQEFQQLNTQWMDNDTLKFDFNEQGGRLLANPDGSVTISQAMTADGSFHDGSAINMTDTSNYPNVFTMAFKQPDGTFLHKTFNYGEPIQKPWADMLYQKDDGTWGFKGGEGSHVSWGKLEGDTFYSAASVPSDGESIDITDTVEKTPASTSYEIKGLEHHSEFTPTAAVVGVPGTRGLSKARTPDRGPDQPPYTPYYTPYNSYEGFASAEQLQQAQADRIPELREDPEARIGLSRALAWHDEITRQKDPEYASDIDRTVESNEDLKNLDAKTKAIVTIPVGALFESDNIYKTLSLYARQEKEAKESTLILLHVNWMDSDENDPKVIETRKQIELAKQRFPDLRISVIESVWSKEKKDAGGYGDRIIGHVSQKMYDAAFAAVRKAISEGRMPEDGDVLVVKNDADALGMDRRYLGKMIRAFEEHPENDTFTGGIRMDTSRSSDLPGFGFVTNFWQVGRIASQLERVGSYLDSFGVNTAARMSTFAAVGGIGHYTDKKGAEPDDLAINKRVEAARMALSPHRLSSRYGATGGGYGATGTDGKPRKRNYHRHVVGATIDTDASRMESVYIEGKPITAAWDNSTNHDGSMNYRAATLQKGQREDLKKNFDEVVSRIELNVAALSNNWFQNETQVRAGLAFMLPGPQSYRLDRKDDGRLEFHLTPEGKKWLHNRLQYLKPREAGGKDVPDPYGERQARQLYGRYSKRSRINPRYTPARMIYGLTSRKKPKKRT